MADYYTELSVELENKPDWVVQDISDIILAIEEGNIKHAPEWYRQLSPGAEVGMDFPDYVDTCLDGPSLVKHELTERGLWLYSEDHVNITAVVHAIHETMKHYNTPGYVAFEWSHSASKPGLDGFGGGAAFITAEASIVHAAGDWLNEMSAAHDLAEKETGNEARQVR